MKAYQLAPLAALVLAASGCAAFSSDNAPDGSVQVVAAFYPLAYVADRVGGEHVDVTNLTQPGAESHDLELGIRETSELTEAELVVLVEGFQPGVDAAVDENAPGAILDAAPVVDLVAFQEEAGEDEHGDDGQLDPHFWLDPLRMALLGDEVAAQLGDVDEVNAEDYRANAEDLRADLEELDEAYADSLAECTTDTVVVSHDAFGYLTRYGLDFEPVAGLSPDAEPTPADLGRLQALIRDRGVTTVFSERLGSPRVTESLADDLGISTAVLDPLEGLSDETADDDYLSLMTQNLTALEKANGCR